MFLFLDKKDQTKIAAVDSNRQEITYGGLCEFAAEWGNRIRQRCVIMILAQNSIGALAGYIGCIISRKVPLIIGANTRKEALENLKETYCPNYIWKPKGLCEKTEEILYENYEYVLTRGSKKAYPLYGGLSLLLTTSGSTGSPKLVRHNYRNLEIQAANISEFFELNKFDRPLVSLPLQYTMAISSINSHLLVGATLLMTDKSLLSSELWEFVKEYKATSITGVPYSFEIMNRLRVDKREFPDLKLLTQGGGKLDRDIQVKFAEYMHKNGGKYIATYGQTEGSARMAYLPDEYSISKCGSIGKAIPNGTIYILDDNGQRIDTPNKVGEMVFEGENVTLGYAECGDDLAKGDENNGILYTGDLAYKDSDDFIFIVGRKKRFLKLYGHRVSLDECEQFVKNEFKIECACIGNDKLMKVYITNKDYLQPVKKYILEKTQLYANSIQCIAVSAIPKNEAGKTLYSVLGNQ